MLDLLYADGVLGVLFAAMANQVGAVDSVYELRLCLQSLHGTCKPAAGKNGECVYAFRLKHAGLHLCLRFLPPCDAFRPGRRCERTRAGRRNRQASGPGARGKKKWTCVFVVVDTKLSLI